MGLYRWRDVLEARGVGLLSKHCCINTTCVAGHLSKNAPSGFWDAWICVEDPAGVSVCIEGAVANG